MKLIQINVWCGRVRELTLKFIKDQDADIVCAQEVVHTESTLPGLFDEYLIHRQISEKYPYTFFSPTFDFELYGSKIIFGNVIYSKFPISNQETFFTHGYYENDKSILNDSGTNMRNLQICSIKTPHGNISISNHHGYHTLNELGDNTSIESIQKVTNVLSRIEGPLIFAGDLNLSYESPAIDEFDRLSLINHTKLHKITSTLSILSRVPVDVPCDYIFTSLDIEVESFVLADNLVSDHKALILDFSI